MIVLLVGVHLCIASKSVKVHPPCGYIHPISISSSHEHTRYTIRHHHRHYHHRPSRSPQFHCPSLAARRNQDQSKAQHAPPDCPVRPGLAEMHIYRVCQRLCQAPSVATRPKEIALSEDICVEESVAKTELETQHVSFLLL